MWWAICTVIGYKITHVQGAQIKRCGKVVSVDLVKMDMVCIIACIHICSTINYTRFKYLSGAQVSQ